MAKSCSSADRGGALTLRIDARRGGIGVAIIGRANHQPYIDYICGGREERCSKERSMNQQYVRALIGVIAKCEASLTIDYPNIS